MPKLKKEVFDKTFRFREAREGSLVRCVSCINMSRGTGYKEEAFCEHLERFRKIKIAEYWAGYMSGENSHNIASEMVCDAYASKQLPEGISLPILPEKHIILLGSQSKDIYHADPNCPYVIEELRMAMTPQEESKQDNPLAYLTKPGVHIADISDLVPKETVGHQICEMPCCDNKLPYQTWRVDNYRRRVMIKPDGTEPKIWVRKVVDHEKRVKLTPEEIEAVFDLSRFNSLEFGRIHDKIVAVSDYLDKNCNRLGSRPLCEAINPIELSYHHIWQQDPLVNPDTNPNLEYWVYDERLFDGKDKLKAPIRDLETIPEGFIQCIDTKKVFRDAIFYCRGLYGSFSIYGIVRKQEDKDMLSKGLSHFIEIGAVSFHDTQYMWGEFGRGFDGLASFHEQ